MSYAGKILGKKAILAMLSLIAAFGCFGLAQEVVNAQAAPTPRSNNHLPRADNFSQGGNIWLLVGRRGAGYTLDAESETVRIYTTQRSGTVRIDSGRNCNSQPEDAGTITNTYAMYAVPALNNNPAFSNTPYANGVHTAPQRVHGSGGGVRPLIDSQDLSCGFSQIAWNLKPSHSQAQYMSTIGPFAGYYAIEFAAVVDGGVGNNKFKLMLDGGEGFLSYYAGSGDHFALKAQVNTGRGNFRLGFAPGCGLDEGEQQDVRVRWFDADAGVANQQPPPLIPVDPIRVVIREYRTNAAGVDVYTGREIVKLVRTGDDVGSVQGFGSGQDSIRVNGHRKYQITWQNINHDNGIQFELPFDSFNTRLNYDECPQAECVSVSYSPTPGPYPWGTSVAVSVRVRNSSGYDWPANFSLRQFNPTPAVNVPTGVVVPSGEEHTFVFPGIVRSTNTTVGLSYHMVDNFGARFGISPLCEASITWSDSSPPPVALEVTCTTITISGVGSAGSVDARLVFTHSGGFGPSPVTHRFNIPAGPADYVINSAFNTVGELLPHNVYTVRLENDTTGALILSASMNGGNECMQAACITSIGGDPEPGETVPINYGAQLTNFTDKEFPDGTYTVRVAGSPPLSIDPDSWTIDDVALAAGGPSGTTTAFTGSENVRIFYTTTLTAELFYDDTDNLGGIYPTEFPCPRSLTPETRPYLKILGGDVSAGGAFESGGCAAGVGPDPVNPYPGGIRTFANPNEQNGSSVDFAAYALGLIEGTVDGPYGFYSSESNHGNGYNGLSFANYPAGTDYNGGEVGALGGLLGGIPPAASQCTHDFFAESADLTSSSPSGPINLATRFTSDERILYDVGGGQLFISGQLNDVRVTIFVEGDVVITGNISYPASWDIDSPPYLAIIAQGDIIVRNNVTVAEGLFVAQPQSDGSHGIFSTCSPNNSATTSDNQITSDCRSAPGINRNLEVNGAVIAKEVRLYRSGQTMFNNSGAAEVFNFVPSMVLGIPNFGDPSDDFESLLSLPPVF